MLKLSDDNYYSKSANICYMSVSQYKAFKACEAAALAEINGEYSRPITDALLIGSYVDAYFEGTLQKFKDDHPEIFMKSGELKAQYRHADYMIARATRDKTFMQYMSGEKQVIMTGEISGIPFKIKIDSYHADKCIVDLKCMKDFSSVWDTETQKRMHWITKWGYDIQGAAYQEIVRQNTGKVLPFYIAGITKEKPEPDMQLYWIPDSILSEKLSEVQNLANRYNKIKLGELKPVRCGKCAYCRATKVISKPINFLDEVEVYNVESE